MEELDTERPARSGGPSTPEGKAKSSRNSMKHGCRSKVVILPNEKQEDFDDVCERWMTEFEPENDAELHFVQEIILNDWFLQRSVKRYNALETGLANVDFTNWTDAQHKQMQLALRYKGEAERSLNRAIRAADTWRRNRSQEARRHHHDCIRAESQLHAVRTKIIDDIAESRRIRGQMERKMREGESKYGMDFSSQRAELQRLGTEQEAQWSKFFFTRGDLPIPAG